MQEDQREPSKAGNSQGLAVLQDHGSQASQGCPDPASIKMNNKPARTPRTGLSTQFLGRLRQESNFKSILGNLARLYFKTKRGREEEGWGCRSMVALPCTHKPPGSILSTAPHARSIAS